MGWIWNYGTNIMYMREWLALLAGLEQVSCCARMYSIQMVKTQEVVVPTYTLWPCRMLAKGRLVFHWSLSAPLRFFTIRQGVVGASTCFGCSNSQHGALAKAGLRIPPIRLL